MSDVLKSHLVYVHVDNDIKNFRGGGLMDLILVIMETMTWPLSCRYSKRSFWLLRLSNF